jgi:hypothetical protein
VGGASHPDALIHPTFGARDNCRQLSLTGAFPI